MNRAGKKCLGVQDQEKLTTLLALFDITSHFQQERNKNAYVIVSHNTLLIIQCKGAHICRTESSCNCCGVGWETWRSGKEVCLAERVDSRESSGEKEWKWAIVRLFAWSAV